MSKQVPEAQVNLAKLKVLNAKKIHKEIETDIQSLVEKTEQLKLKLENLVHNEDNPDGFLTHSIDIYHRCLSLMDRGKLTKLIKDDMKHWENCVKEAMKSKDLLNLQL